VLLLDRCLVGGAISWETLAARVEPTRMGEVGSAGDRRLVAELGDRPPARPLLLVLGSSRGEAAFHPEWLPEEERPAGSVARFAHPGLRPFELRSLVEALLPLEPDAAVFLLSEFETHYPLELRPELSSGSLAAVADLLRAGGPRFAWEERVGLARLTLAGLLRGYRDRAILGAAGLERLRRFPLDARLAAPEKALDWLLAPAERRPVPPALRQQVEAAAARFLPPESAIAVAVEMRQLRALSRGAHQRIQELLLRRAAERLLAAGSAVVLFETPLFPGAAPLADPSFRGDFLAFARSLAREPGVRFVPLEEEPRYQPGDFKDLTHLAEAGARKLTRAALAAAREALAERASRRTTPAAGGV
jgi:hypothetical protein